MALSTRAWGMVLRRSTTWSLPRRPAHSEISSTPAVAVLMPPAVEPEEPPISISTTDRAAAPSRRAPWSKTLYPAVRRVTD